MYLAEGRGELDIGSSTMKTIFSYFSLNSFQLVRLGWSGLGAGRKPVPKPEKRPNSLNQGCCSGVMLIKTLASESIRAAIPLVGLSVALEVTSLFILNKPVLFRLSA